MKHKCYQLNQIELHQKDCLTGMAEQEADSVSVVVTSPPYNLGIKYNSYDDTIPRQEYLQWIEEWTEAVKRVLDSRGALFLNVGASLKDPWIAMDVGRIVGRQLVLQNTFHWIKSISIDGQEIDPSSRIKETISVGHYKPINSKRYVNDCHEYVFHFTQTGDIPIDRRAMGVPYKDKSNINRWKSAGVDRRCRGNNWFIPYQTIASRKHDRPHPATFPEKLVESCLKLYGIPLIERVMDPFSGIGTTAVVCKRFDLPFIGYEIDPEYFDESVCRLEDRRDQPGLFD